MLPGQQDLQDNPGHQVRKDQLGLKGPRVRLGQTVNLDLKVSLERMELRDPRVPRALQGQQDRRVRKVSRALQVRQDPRVNQDHRVRLVLKVLLDL